METEFYRISPDGGSITCKICCSTSFHPCDVREKFCSRCKVFHGERQPDPLAEKMRRDIRAYLRSKLHGETIR